MRLECTFDVSKMATQGRNEEPEVSGSLAHHTRVSANKSGKYGTVGTRALGHIQGLLKSTRQCMG
jgi:hypothetical protein